MLNEDSTADLKRSLRGRLIQPGDADYGEARKVYNRMIHKKPRLIAQCVDVADVIRSTLSLAQGEAKYSQSARAVADFKF
jgi:hypothetical protein